MLYQQRADRRYPNKHRVGPCPAESAIRQTPTLARRHRLHRATTGAGPERDAPRHRRCRAAAIASPPALRRFSRGLSGFVTFLNGMIARARDNLRLMRHGVAPTVILARQIGVAGARVRERETVFPSHRQRSAARGVVSAGQGATLGALTGDHSSLPGRVWLWDTLRGGHGSHEPPPPSRTGRDVTPVR